VPSNRPHPARRIAIALRRKQGKSSAQPNRWPEQAPRRNSRASFSHLTATITSPRICWVIMCRWLRPRPVPRDARMPAGTPSSTPWRINSALVSTPTGSPRGRRRQLLSGATLESDRGSPSRLLGRDPKPQRLLSSRRSWIGRRRMRRARPHGQAARRCRRSVCSIRATRPGPRLPPAACGRSRGRAQPSSLVG
jgi:hypothetical protein